jgi:uncharacterized protein
MKYRLILLLLFPACFLLGQPVPDPMSPPRLVNDFAGIYSSNEISVLEQMLRRYNDTTSTQIYVVTVAGLDEYAISDYAFRLGEKWGVGQKGKDNGAIILIKPKSGNERGQVFIAVGYGLEAVLTDARCGRIIDDCMLPHFKENDYYTGTKNAVEIIIACLSGQFKADSRENEQPSSILCILFIILFIVFVIYVSRKQNGNDDSNSSGDDFFPPVFPMGRGGFGGGNFGGGFSGGGGGRFGGGGAGRSW